MSERRVMRLGLSGRCCAGKDSCAEVLGYHKLPLAGALKEEVVSGLVDIGLPLDLAYLEEHKSVFRGLLQTHGDVVRHFDPVHYVNIVRRRALSLAARGIPVAVTDVRYPNEVEALEEAGFVIVRLEVSPLVQDTRYRARYGRSLTDAERLHQSETALDDYRFLYSVNADQPLEDMVAAVRKIIS